MKPIFAIDLKALRLYKRILLTLTFFTPFLNRYNPSPINLLIASLLGFFVGILVCLFHYELFYRGKRLKIYFGAGYRLALALSLFVIIVDAVGRAFMVGMMKLHWVTHLILMGFVYLFLGAVISAEALRNNFSIIKLFLQFMLFVVVIRAVAVLLALNFFTATLSYLYGTLILSNIIGFILLIPGVLLGYKKCDSSSIF